MALRYRFFDAATAQGLEDWVNARLKEVEQDPEEDEDEDDLPRVGDAHQSKVINEIAGLSYVTLDVQVLQSGHYFATMKFTDED